MAMISLTSVLTRTFSSTVCTMSRRSLSDAASLWLEDLEGSAPLGTFPLRQWSIGSVLSISLFPSGTIVGQSASGGNHLGAPAGRATERRQAAVSAPTAPSGWAARAPKRSRTARSEWTWCHPERLVILYRAEVMFISGSSMIDTIRQRYSCRTYDGMPIAADTVRQLGQFAGLMKTGPVGAPSRFELIATTEGDSTALRGLGTYGLIKHPAGFIVGAVGQGMRNLEDFGYGMEAIVLQATDLDLATCWLGGTFTKSSFSKAIGATGEEKVPAVVAVGYAAQESRDRDQLRRWAKSDQRLPWDEMFFQGSFGNPLSQEMAGAYAGPLEAVRLAPSSSNHQPWRVVEEDSSFHFYLQRAGSYGLGTLSARLFRLADLQRVDLGIAMCHFELVAMEVGLEGQWDVREPALRKPASTEYVASWTGRRDVISDSQIEQRQA
jgi:nitroreductase